MKLKLIILVLLLSNMLFPSNSSLIYTYIPMYNERVKIADKDGVQLRKVLFYTNNKGAKSSIESAIWSYKINTPHKKYKEEGNVAYAIGLKLSLVRHHKFFLPYQNLVPCSRPALKSVGQQVPTLGRPTLHFLVMHLKLVDKSIRV